MVKVGGKSYVFSSIDQLEEWIEKFVKVVANHNGMLQYFKAKMDCRNPSINPTVLADGFFRDGFRRMAYPNIFQGLDRHRQVSLKIILSKALSAELDLGNAPYPDSLEGIIPMDLPRSRPNFEQPKLETIPMHIERPINVIGTRGCINILTATVETLAKLIREAQEEIEINKDLALISKAYAKKAVELEKIIELCVKQLDKVAK